MAENRSEIKSKLYEELLFKAKVYAHGINITDKALDLLRTRLGKDIQEAVYDLYLDTENKTPLYPVAYYTPHGLFVPFRRDIESEYSIDNEGDLFFVTLKDNKVFDITFPKRPEFYSKFNSDGSSMSQTAILLVENCLGVCYSNECSLKDKGEDCLFCSINSGIREPYWKNPIQIAETVAEAYREGIVKRVHFTGGLVPERREMDYYIDAMEAINSKIDAGTEVKAMASCAAPQDLDQFNRFKEVGFIGVEMNLEIWDKNIFKTICPGKSNHIGGWENWVAALEYAAKVFGFGVVGTNFVAGIEPKVKTLEGIEYLASKGVTASIEPLMPRAGTAFEGLYPPRAEWVLDLAYRQIEVQRKYGITYEHLFYSSGREDRLAHDIYRIEDELFPAFSSAI